MEEHEIKQNEQMGAWEALRSHLIELHFPVLFILSRSDQESGTEIQKGIKKKQSMLDLVRFKNMKVQES